MANYWQWNQAIVEYFTAGTAQDIPVFLSVDEEALHEIAEGFLGESVEGVASEDFVQAVRTQCLVTGMPWVNIEDLKRETADVPLGVGFLVLMVYAAYNMQEEEGIDESNYFVRLREALGLPEEQGRPEGLKPAGVEEPLWLAWNEYLIESGFEPTAERGAGPQTYLRYVLSQAILRESDKAYLRDRYSEAHLSTNMDPGQLGTWLSRQNLTRRHLSEGLHHPDLGRVWEFYQAAHRVYEVGEWRGLEPGPSMYSPSRTIMCGLYVQEKLDGDTAYWVFPQQPKRSRVSELTAYQPGDDGPLPLLQMRAGFFAPLHESHPFVDEPIEYEVHGESTARKMVFPQRDFWILMRDPENPDGPWATWSQYPELGQELMILCRKGPFTDEMYRLRESKLVEWMQTIDKADFTVFLGCMVLSYDFAGFIQTSECTALSDSLSPRSMATIALSSGLRDGVLRAWIEGHPPTMTVYGFENRFEIDIKGTRSGPALQDMEIQRQVPLHLVCCQEPDTYQIEARAEGKLVATRLFRVVAWEDLQPKPGPTPTVNRNPAATGGLSLRGPMVVADHSSSEEGNNG